MFEGQGFAAANNVADYKNIIHEKVGNILNVSLAILSIKLCFLGKGEKGISVSTICP